RGVVLEKGQVILNSDVQSCIRCYREQAMTTQPGVSAPIGADRRTHILRSVTLLDELGKPTSYLPLGGSFHIRIVLETSEPIDHPVFAIGFDDLSDQRILTVATPLSNPAVEHIQGPSKV